MPNKKMVEEKIEVETGSSNGIGYGTSLLLAKKGFLTYATVRKMLGKPKQ